MKQLYHIPSPSGREQGMIRFITRRLDALGVDHHTDRHGNIYAVKGLSETYPCVVCHTDEVHAGHPEGYRVVTAENGIIFGYDTILRRHCGTGADDKNGIWVCLKCLEGSGALKCAFFVSEEAGCVGSSRADMAFFRDCRYVIQCDRRGHGDMVTRAGTGRLCSGSFIKDVSPREYGYRQAEGMLTDVVALKQRGLEVSCANISCGYYYPHTEHEFTDFGDLKKCLAFVRHIIRDCTQVYSHRKEKGKAYSFFGDERYGFRQEAGLILPYGDIPESSETEPF